MEGLLDQDTVAQAAFSDSDNASSASPRCGANTAPSPRCGATTAPSARTVQVQRARSSGGRVVVSVSPVYTRCDEDEISRNRAYEAGKCVDVERKFLSETSKSKSPKPATSNPSSRPSKRKKAPECHGARWDDDDSSP
ncbi:unnamed protein product [Sphacelaria rigidula]